MHRCAKLRRPFSDTIGHGGRWYVPWSGWASRRSHPGSPRIPYGDFRIVLASASQAFLRMRQKGRVRMKRRDEYIVGHSDRGIVAAVTEREMAKAIACQLWREHPTGGAYITHRGRTWRYTGEWNPVTTPSGAPTPAARAGVHGG